MVIANAVRACAKPPGELRLWAPLGVLVCVLPGFKGPLRSTPSREGRPGAPRAPLVRGAPPIVRACPLLVLVINSRGLLETAPALLDIKVSWNTRMELSVGVAHVPEGGGVILPTGAYVHSFVAPCPHSMERQDLVPVVSVTLDTPRSAARGSGWGVPSVPSAEVQWRGMDNSAQVSVVLMPMAFRELEENAHAKRAGKVP